MSALGTIAMKNGFRMFAKVKGLSQEVIDEISKSIDTYIDDLRNDEDAYVGNYIPDKYVELFEASTDYIGIVDNLKQHPCSLILSDGDIREEIGIICTKNHFEPCANIEGTTAEALGYVKNDFLLVTVVGLIEKLYQRIGMQVPSAKELYKMVDGDKKVWDLYANGYTQGLNQVEQASTTSKCKAYKPSTVEELCNFIAGIRPGAKSIYKQFESREHFEYGQKDIDNLLKGEFLQSSFLLYQEQIMLLLEWLGFPQSETYTILKAISKKKEGVIEGIKSRFMDSMKDRGINDDIANKLWIVVVDNSKYSL